MSKTIKILGLASKKELIFTYTDRDLDTLLFDFLKSKEVHIASSCSGNGVCRKCIVTVASTEVLTCQISLRKLLKIGNSVTVSYL